MAKPKLWAVKVFHHNTDDGYLIDHGRVVCVYSSESDAEKDTKWLNEIHKKSASKTNYRAVRFKQEEEEVERRESDSDLSEKKVVRGRDSVISPFQ